MRRIPACTPSLNSRRNGMNTPSCLSLETLDPVLGVDFPAPDGPRAKRHLFRKWSVGDTQVIGAARKPCELNDRRRW
jgi:hypothetical protein